MTLGLTADDIALACKHAVEREVDVDVYVARHFCVSREEASKFINQARKAGHAGRRALDQTQVRGVVMTKKLTVEQQRKMQAGRRRKKREREREAKERLERVTKHHQQRHGRPRRSRKKTKGPAASRSLIDRAKAALAEVDR